VILTPLDDDLLLVTVARGDFNLGRMRLIIRRFVDQISSAVAAI